MPDHVYQAGRRYRYVQALPQKYTASPVIARAVALRDKRIYSAGQPDKKRVQRKYKYAAETDGGQFRFADVAHHRGIHRPHHRLRDHG
jgi:hypothetical protein